MKMTEATPSLKPSKHRWYTAVLAVLVVALLANIVECLMDNPPEFRTPIDGLEYLFYVIGRMSVTVAVGATTLVGSLLLLFIFDGWVSKAIVTCILALWTFRQATILKRTLDSHHSKATVALQQKPAALSLEGKQSTPITAKSKLSRRSLKHAPPSPAPEPH